MVNAVSGNNNNISLSNLLQPKFTGGRVNIPLRGGAGYVKFKHVSGVPSGNPKEGLSVFKLRMLDTLIDRLASMKSERPEKQAIGGMNEEALDALIEELETQLHQKTIQAQTIGYDGALGLGAQAQGALVSSYA